MTLAACCMSHSPLPELTAPGPELIADVEKAIAAARDFVRDYDPELVIVLAPDYRPIPEFIAGSGVTTAVPASAGEPG
jgi:2,3-dihydroxyphenylpropionate 1,2-dioxygenase